MAAAAFAIPSPFISSNHPSTPSTNDTLEVVVSNTSRSTLIPPGNDVEVRRCSCRAFCRQVPCAVITFIALLALGVIALDQSSRLAIRNLDAFNEEYTSLILQNATAMADDLLTQYNDNNQYLRTHWVPAGILGTISPHVTCIYLGTLSDSPTTPARVASIGLTLTGAGTFVAGAFATVAGLTYGGPLIIAVGATTAAIGLTPPKKIEAIRQKVNLNIASVCSRLSRCVRYCFSSNSDI